MKLTMLKRVCGGLLNVSGIKDTASRVLSQDVKTGYEVYHGGNIHKVIGVRKAGNVVHCETKHGHVSFPFGCPVICYKVKK